MTVGQELTADAGPIRRLLPGVALTAAIACAALALHQVPGVAVLSPLFIAIAIGAAIRNVSGVPQDTQDGIVFSVRRVLRAAVILLGLQLSLMQIVNVGLRGLLITMAALFATMFFTRWLGKMFGVEPKLVELIGAGTSICGASAIIAMNLVTNASDEDVTYSVASVTIFGTIFMFIFPLLAHLFQLGPHAYGLWAGASIHEVAQVVAAAFQLGPDAGGLGVVAKLTRVLMLAPILLVLSALSFKRLTASGKKRVPQLPIFVFGFVCTVLFNSFVAIGPDVRPWLTSLTTFLFAMALAALGLETDFRKLKARGLRPLALGAVSSVFIAALSLSLIKLMF